MRRLVSILVLLVLSMSLTGCFLPIYSGEPFRRTKQLLVTSENLRQLLDDWERFWLLDQPSHLTPMRTHGGIL